MESNNNHVANPLSIERVEDSERQPERSASEIFSKNLMSMMYQKISFGGLHLDLVDDCFIVYCY